METETIKRNKYVFAAIKIFFVVVSLISVLFVCFEGFKYHEMDSYALPIESIQYNRSIIMTEDDLEHAKEDFPYLYGTVTSYESLEEARLVQIDDGHWMSYYFPVYAIVCLPVKLFLQVSGWNQEYAFGITNALVFIVALYFAYRYIKRKGNVNIIFPVLLVFGPIWYYLSYIGAEPLMFAAMVVAVLMWDEKRYKTSALIISITSMMNPVVLGFGLILTVDYLFEQYKNDKRFLVKKQGILSFVKLICCWLPALIPFAVNMYYLGVLNPTMGLISQTVQNVENDSSVNRIVLYAGLILAVLCVAVIIISIMAKKMIWLKTGAGVLIGAAAFIFVFFTASGDENLWTRFFAYFIDLNLGFASVSVILVILFAAALVYSVVKKKRQLFWISFSTVFTIILLSFNMHINCGMFNIARYLVWVYPFFIFAIHVFLCSAFNKKTVFQVVITAVTAASVVGIFIVNGNTLGYNYRYLSNVSKKLLDRFPVLYINCCPSTFNSRTKHIDGGYDTEGLSFYKDEATGQLRKIMYYNTEEYKDILNIVIESDEDTDLELFNDRLSDENDEKIYFINIPRSSEVQYTVKDAYMTGMYENIIDFYEQFGIEYDMAEAVDIGQDMLDGEKEILQEMYDYVKDDSLSDEEYIENLYKKLFGREGTKEEMSGWVEKLKKGGSRYDVFLEILHSIEFAGSISN